MAEDNRPPQRPGTRPGIEGKRDSQGRFTERTIRMGGRLGDFTETRRYAYDAAGRLSRVTGDDGDQPGRLCESYTYDQQGRRLADICPELRRGERRFTYGPGNRLLQAGGVQYGHDRAGFRNLKVEATKQGQDETRYEYEPSGLLLAVDLPADGKGGRRIDYAYDASGLRTEKRLTVKGESRVVEEFIWLDALRLGAFHDGSQWWRLIYDPQGQNRSPRGLESASGQRLLLLCDQVGTPVALANIDANIVQHMRYDSFGNLLEQRGDIVRLPLGFAGGLYDADTGLTRFVWRDYDAATGRFTALDPLGAKGGDKDWYGYCVDDPVNRVDVCGLWSLFGADSGGARAEKSSSGDESGNKPYFCNWAKCDDNGTMQGDYKPIEGREGVPPFMFQLPLDPIVDAFYIPWKNGWFDKE